jgi:hypothetical protein
LAQAKKIYQATFNFIEAYRTLKEHGQMPRHEELCKIMGINSMATLSEILAKRQNIQPAQWEKFKSYFGLIKNHDSLTSEISEPTTLAEPTKSYSKWSPKFESPGESNYLPELLTLLKKQSDVLDTISANLNMVTNVQKMILEQLKDDKPVKPKKAKNKTAK